MTAAVLEPLAPSPLPAEVEALLQPLSAESPVGPALRFDPVFTEIRLEREEDDPRAPMRQWERPLKVADWARVERLSTEFLRTRSKDLQMAAWTLEAWFRQRELQGLLDGLRLISGLLTRYWEGVHPVIDEDGDSDARAAVLEWLNEELPLWLRTRVMLVRIPDQRPPIFTPDDWSRLTTQEMARESSPPPKSRKAREAKEAAELAESERPVVTRELIQDLIRAEGGRRQVEQVRLTRACLAEVRALDALLKERLALQAPSLAKVTRELELLERTVMQLLAAAPLELLDPPPSASRAAAPIQPNPPSIMAHDDTPPVYPQESERAIGMPAAAQPVQGGWTSRDQAYRTLEAVADYLARSEPHSPTPYLIRRAVNWGRMPLPELMAEFQREEGDLNKLVKLLGLGGREDGNSY